MKETCCWHFSLFIQSSCKCCIKYYNISLLYRSDLTPWPDWGWWRQLTNIISQITRDTSVASRSEQWVVGRVLGENIILDIYCQHKIDGSFIRLRTNLKIGELPTSGFDQKDTTTSFYISVFCTTPHHTTPRHMLLTLNQQLCLHSNILISSFQSTLAPPSSPCLDICLNILRPCLF